VNRHHHRKAVGSYSRNLFAALLHLRYQARHQPLRHLESPNLYVLYQELAESGFQHVNGAAEENAVSRAEQHLESSELSGTAEIFQVDFGAHVKAVTLDRGFDVLRGGR